MSIIIDNYLKILNEDTGSVSKIINKSVLYAQKELKKYRELGHSVEDSKDAQVRALRKCIPMCKQCNDPKECERRMNLKVKSIRDFQWMGLQGKSPGANSGRG